MGSFFYTYVLRSEKDRELYIGWTDDLRKRLANHNKGMVESTKARVPLELIYYEACLDREAAIKREKSPKTGFGRKFLRDRLKL